MKRIARINLSFVKGFRLSHPDEVVLGTDGVEDNRRFLLVDADGQHLRGSVTSWPVRLRADYDAGAEQLSIHFPNRTMAEGDAVARGQAFHSTAGTIDVTGRASSKARGTSRSRRSPASTCGWPAPTARVPA